MGGVAYKDGYVAKVGEDESYGGYAVFAVPSGMRSFACDVGVTDERDDSHGSGFTPTYAVWLDGSKVKSGDLQPGTKPLHLVLSLNGTRSIRLDASDGAGFGDPVLLRASAASQESSAPATDLRPRLTGPGDEAEVSGDRVELRWTDLPQATCYGVEVVCSDLDDPNEEAPRIWGVTVRNNHLTLSLNGMRPGRYRWSVLAFTSRKRLGGFSGERYFIVR